MKHKRASRQRNLFEEKRSGPEIPDDLRTHLIRLIGELLIAAIKDGGVKAKISRSATREVRHEQDIA